MRIRIPLVILVTLLAFGTAPRPAGADATVFLGRTLTPSNRMVRGVAAGVSLLVVGFEFEYANTNEDTATGAPSLRTGMGNAIVQTPFAIGGLQLYGTVGAGAYQERRGAAGETNVGINAGGGVKISLAGPLRVRVDYRLFTLRGSPLHARVHRAYAGLNLMF